MTPEELGTAGQKLFGRKKWKLKFAAALGVHRQTLYEWLNGLKPCKHPWPAMVSSLLENARRQRELEAAARRLMPRLKREAKAKK